MTHEKGIVYKTSSKLKELKIGGFNGGNGIGRFVSGRGDNYVYR